MVDLTIVTPSLNHGRFIAEALSSVAVRPPHRVEHIVVDGGSSDGTSALLMGRPGLVRISDAGASSHDAINRGIAEAQGALIGVLSADDAYEPGALDRVIDAFRDDPTAETVCGGLTFFRDDSGQRVEVARRGHLSGEALMVELTFGAPGFNSWFFRRDLVHRLGRLDPAWDFSADRDFLLRLVRAVRPRILAAPLYRYRLHPGSRTLDPGRANRRTIAREHVRLARHHLAQGCHDPAARALLTAWWGYEWAKLAVLERARPEGPCPPPGSLPRALWTRWRLPRMYR